MGIFKQAFWGVFFGKIAAAFFLAICLLLRFGPEEWAKFMIQDLPTWITPGIARTAFLLMGVITAVYLIFSFRNKKSVRKVETAIEASAAEKKENYAITLEVKRTFRSDEVPSLSPVPYFDYMADPFTISCGGGSTIRNSMPDKDRILPFYNFICEVELSNAGDKGIFNLSIPIKLSYFKAVNGGGILNDENLIHTSDQVLPLNKLESGKSITFWIFNSTSYAMKIEFFNYLVGETHIMGKDKIPYVYVPFHFRHVLLHPRSMKK